MRPLTFVSFSSFTPGSHQQLRPNVVSQQSYGTRMVTPKHIRRSNEIKRLERQLEELRALREKLAHDKAHPISDSQPKPRADEPERAPPIPDLLSMPQKTASDFITGKHNEESRFLSIASVDSEEFPTRILTIAGVIPELTTAQFKSTPAVLTNKRPDKGNLVITKLPEHYHGDIMSLPGSEVLAGCGDPVLVLAEQSEVSATSLPISEGDLVALVVDRDMNRRTFESTNFYVWDVRGNIRVGWAKEEPHPSQAECVGQVVFGIMEIKPDLRQKKSCWEEENETYV
ncbi:unnamed protein product [Agarophyton chilense]